MNTKYCVPRVNVMIGRRTKKYVRNEALFKDPSAKGGLSNIICFLPMPLNLISCVSLTPATILYVPIYDFAVANRELSEKLKEMLYYSKAAGSVHGCAS